VAKLGSVLKLAGVAVVALGVGTGAAFGVMHFLGGTVTSAHAATQAPQKAAPIFFAQLDDITVSMPPEAGQPADSYVDIGIQFSTHDQKAVDAFTTLEPIVKANVLALMMAQNTQGLQSEPARSAIIAQCLDIANNVVEKNANYQTAPFINGYITNLMVQSSD
jgi:flagellar basal body-associated protein FliL